MPFQCVPNPRKRHHHFPFRQSERGAKRERPKVHEVGDLWLGLGRREAQRKNIANRRSLEAKGKRLNRCQSSRASDSDKLIRRVISRILLARVNPSAGAKLAAGMLPKLTPVVPMKAKLRKLCRHITRLLSVKLNPNPLADDFTQLPKARRFVIEHVQDSRGGKSAIVKSLPKINPRQFA
jgi:hypothetical protein